MKRLTIGALSLFLMSCGETDENSLTNQVAGLVFGGGEATPAPASPRVTEEQLLASRGQYLRVNIRDLERRDTMVPAGSNGARTTWIDSASISLTLDDGIVVATRGLPRDLMGADARSTARAIQAGGGTAERRHDYLTDQDQIVTNTLQCTISSEGSDEVARFGQTIPATRYQEVCTGEGLNLTNIYWVNGARGIVRSLQAVSPDAGYLQIDVF